MWVGLAAFTQSADLPTPVRTAASSDADKAAIETYVKGQIAKIASGQGAGQARDELARQPEATPAVTPSASFQSVYGQAVINDIVPLLSDKNVNKRLNAAIVVYRVANATKAAQFAPLAEKVMQDASSAVAIWGVKSGGVLLPGTLGVAFNRNKQTLTKAIVAAAKAHAEAGPLIQDAYNALSLPDQNPPLPKEAYPPVIDAINELMSFRKELYVKGIPSTPQAEGALPVFFVRGAVTGAMTPAQNLAVTQNLMDLLSLSAQHTASAGGEQRQAMIGLMTRIAGAMKVTLDAKKLPAAAKFDPISRLRDPIKSDQVLQQISDALNALRALPEYKGLKDAPQIAGG
jgi:hypothetical protein